MAANPRTRRDRRATRREPARGRFEREDAEARAPVEPVEPVEPAEPAPAPPPSDWRSTVATASGLNLLAGIWLIIPPFVLGYGNGDPYWNDIIFGAIVAVFALARLSGAYRAEWLSWLNALIGVWIFVSAFWLDSTSRAGWNDIILGVVVFVLAIVSATARGEAEYVARPWYRR